MSPTVDDLLISLTIKKGSDLDGLKQQLDSLVGKDGKKKLDFSNIKDLVIIKKDVRSINQQMRFLLPARMGNTSQEIAHAASRMLLQSKKYGKTALEEAINVRPQDVPKLYKRYGVEEGEKEKLLENLQEGFLRDIEAMAEAYSSGSLTDVTTGKEFLRRYNNFLFGAGGRQKIGALTDLQKMLIEPQEDIEKILKEIGVKIDPQKSIYKIKSSILSNPIVEKFLSERTSDLESPYVTGKEKRELQKLLGVKTSIAESRSFIDVFVKEGGLNLKKIMPDKADLIDKLGDSFMLELKSIITPDDINQIKDRVEKSIKDVLFLALAAQPNVPGKVAGIKGAHLAIMSGTKKIMEDLGIIPEAISEKELSKRTKQQTIESAELQYKKMLDDLNELKKSADNSDGKFDTIISMLKTKAINEGINIEEKTAGDEYF